MIMKQMVIPRKTSRARNRCFGGVIVVILVAAGQEESQVRKLKPFFHPAEAITIKILSEIQISYMF
jgi:hypothetical protein